MIKLSKKIKTELSNISIRYKLLLAFFILSILPVLFIAIGSYGISSKVIEKKTAQFSHDILIQTKKTMENHLEKIEDISFNIFINSKFQELMLKASEGTLDEYEGSKLKTEIEDILSSQVLYHDEINAIFVVSDGSYIYKLDKTKQNYGLMKEYEQEIKKGQGSIEWFGALKDKRVVALTRCINSVKTQKPIGYMVIYVNINYLDEVLSNTQSVMGGNIYAVDNKGTIVVNSDENKIGTISEAVNANTLSRTYNFSTQTIHGTTQYVSLSETMDNGWRIVTTVPVSTYQSEIINLKNTILLVVVIILILSILCSWSISLSISKPVKRLTTSMGNFGTGDLSIRCPEGAKDEIGKCSQAFNHMAENINFLVNQVYEEQLMKREAELKSLQMQINPHFLYNTLETINWMARTQGNNDIGIMAKALGDLMRATINGNHYVLLKDEMASLNNYLMIQKYRYGDKFETKIDVAVNTENLYIPKLIIQPLVENAIYHGIEPAFDNGLIRISTSLQKNNLLIVVSDDGVGMSQEKIDELLSCTNDKNDSEQYSIGIKNVIKRIKTLYGDEYGISIQSDFGDGTVISMWIPAIYEN
jgi:Predicted signal transduction protein with a C-terminal ATPase domain